MSWPNSPTRFIPAQKARATCGASAKGLAGLPVVVELRNAAWLREPTFALLRDLQLGYCCVDEPRLKGLLPSIAVATGPVAYARFHGRNAAKWYAHEEAWERYNYAYSAAELQEWVPKVRQLEQAAETTLVYFNNHYSGQSVQGARDLQQLLPRVMMEGQRSQPRSAKAPSTGYATSRYAAPSAPAPAHYLGQALIAAKGGSLPILLILLAGVALRVFRLGAGSLWYDETVNVYLAGSPVADLLKHTAGDIHPPATIAFCEVG